MVLLGQLLGGKFVKFGHFARKNLGSGESLGKEHDLGNEPVVGDHHGHGAEEDFEVVGQLGSALVARVHGDEDPHSGVQFDLLFVEPEVFLFETEGVFDSEELLGDDGEDFNVDTVEFVKAGPGAGVGKACEELCHHFVVDLLGTVENDAEFSNRFG